MRELSGYNVIIATAADAAGDSETRVVCEESLRKEEVMVRWLKDYVASATIEYLDGEETPGAAAKPRRFPSSKDEGSARPFSSA